MTQKTKAALTLALLSPVLAELLSGNSPATIFFNPWYFLLQILSYGIPVLIIRELALKWKLRIPGIFLLGLAYGIFNEGLLAHTFLMKSSLTFTGYGYYLGVSLAWAPTIAVWHALHSVLYPILLTYFLYPSASSKSWLAPWVVKFFAVLAVLESIVLYFSPHLFAPVYFFVFWAAILLLIALSKKYAGTLDLSVPKKSMAAFWTGLATLVFFVGFLVLAKTTLTLVLYWVLLFAVVRVAWWLIKKKNWTSLGDFVQFACGDYVGNAIFAVLLVRSPEMLIVDAVLIAALLLWVRRARKSNVATAPTVLLA